MATKKTELAEVRKTLEDLKKQAKSLQKTEGHDVSHLHTVGERITLLTERARLLEEADQEAGE